MSGFQFNNNFTDRLIQKYRADELREYTGDYPKQIANTAGRMNGELIMLSVDDHLQIPERDGKTPPLAPVSLSRFEIILKGKGTVVKANLPADEVHTLANKCRMAVQAKMMQTLSGTVNPSQAATAPVRVMVGKFKGKTPEEILLTSPDSLQELKNTANYIFQNLNNPQNAKYREGNLKQLDAIKRAIDQFEKGLLQSAPATSIDIYNGVWKPRGKDIGNGRREGYCLTIRYYLTGDYPWELTIEEGTAPMIQDKEGHVIPQLKQKTIKEVKHINMNDKWLDIVERMDSCLFAFENAVYMGQKAYAEANTYFFKRRKYPERYSPANGAQGYSAQGQAANAGYQGHGGYRQPVYQNR